MHLLYPLNMIKEAACTKKPPLCKGRWVAVRRLGGVDSDKCSEVCLSTRKFIIFYRTIPQSRLTPRQLPLHKGAGQAII